MRHILCYGDSNTWGYTPGSGERHAPDVRWTGVLRRRLGEGWEVLEEGMNGRTTVFDNPMSPGRNGSAYLLTCLETHKPLDLVILMLGTNDLRFTDAWGAAEGAAALVKKVRLYNHMEESTHIFPGKPRILLIAPILAHADLDNRDVIGRWRSYPQKSNQLHSFLSYYLPTTLKILRAYAQLEDQEVDGENITAAMERIEGMMDKVVDGFEKQLDQLFQGEALDITADVEVLERMLAKDGLSSGGDLRMGG